MDNSSLSNRPNENVSSAPTPSKEAPKRADHLSNKEINQVSADVGSAEFANAVGESVDIAAEVSETMRSSASEDKRGSGGGSTTGQAAQTFDPAQIKAQLLKNIPGEKLMRKQIEKEITKEIKYLHRRVVGLLTRSNMSYFEMNNLLRKIRELKSILLELLKTSLEGLKTLWLRFVHGIL